MSQPRRKTNRKRKFTTKSTKNGITITCATPLTLLHLNEWRTDGILCDVRIKVADGIICAHKNILAVNSEYFLTMFTSGMKESNSDYISMETVNHHLMKMLIDFMYTGEIEVTTESAQDLVVLSDMLQMDHLKKQCELFMHRHLEANNCLGMIEFGRKYSCPDLVAKAVSLVKKRFSVMVKSEEMLEVSPPTLREILLYEDLCLGPGGEDVVLEAAVRWLEHDTEERMTEFVDILSHVNLGAVTPTYLQKVLEKAVIREDSVVVGILQNASSQPVKCLRVPQQYIYAIGGYFQSRTGPTCPRTSSVERFNIQTREWATIAPLPILPSLAYAFNMQGRLLVIAFDHHQTDPTNSGSSSDNSSDPALRKGLFEYNYLEDEWINNSSAVSDHVFDLLRETLQGSGSIAYCPKHNHLYLLSQRFFHRVFLEEIDGDIVMEKVNVLSPLHGSSSASEDSNKSHEDDIGLVTHEGNVYGFGGTVQPSKMDYWSSDSVYMYDSKMDEWISRKKMISPRGRVGAVSLDGRLFVVGGFGKYRENKLEVYNPTTDTWETRQDMEKRRSHFCALTAAGKIWAVGGKSYAFGCGGARKVLKTIEMYDSDLDTWTQIEESMNNARCGFAAAVL